MNKLFSRSNLKQIGLYGVLFLGIYLRLMDYFGGHWPYYVHDRDRHVEYVRYVHLTGCLPPPDAGIEFPQQPLYYFLVASLYQPNLNWRVNDAILAGAGLLLSILGLGILMMSLRFIGSWLVRYAILVFVSLTPSLVFAAPFIGNDGMVQVTGFYLFFCALRFNRNPRSAQVFALLAFALLLALFSKLNAITLVLICPWVLWRTYHSPINDRGLRFVAGRGLSLAGVLIFWAVVTWYHGELGRTNAGFKMVTEDKAGLAPLRIPDTGFGYLCSFHLIDFFQACQSTTTSSTPDAVRFSFPTFQYGTLLLGEHEYSHPKPLAEATGPLILSGCVLLIGGCIFVFNTGVKCIPKSMNLTSAYRLIAENSLPLLTLCIITAGTGAVYAYVHGLPYTCDADFRFQYPVLSWFAYSIGRGLASFFPGNRFVKWTLAALLIIYGASCVLLVQATYRYAFTDV